MDILIVLLFIALSFLGLYLLKRITKRIDSQYLDLALTLLGTTLGFILAIRVVAYQEESSQRERVKSTLAALDDVYEYTIRESRISLSLFDSLQPPIRLRDFPWTPVQPTSFLRTLVENGEYNARLSSQARKSAMFFISSLDRYSYQLSLQDTPEELRPAITRMVRDLEWQRRFMQLELDRQAGHLTDAEHQESFARQWAEYVDSLSRR